MIVKFTVSGRDMVELEENARVQLEAFTGERRSGHIIEVNAYAWVSTSQDGVALWRADVTAGVRP